MRSLGATVYYGGLWMIRAAALSRRLRARGPVLCYHNVVASDTPAGDPGLHMSAGRFERQMRWLARHYDVLPLSEYVARLRTGKPLRSAAAVTFDDAYAGVFDYALPILRALSLPATIFVVTGAARDTAAFWWDHPAVIGCVTPQRREHWLRRLRGDGISILRDAGATPGESMPTSHRSVGFDSIRAHAGSGIEFGMHSATHRFLPALSDDELADEVCASRDVLRRHSGATASLFAYPYGAWDTRVAGMVEKAGYEAAFGLDAGQGMCTRLSAIPRVNIPGGISHPAFEAWLAGLSR